MLVVSDSANVVPDGRLVTAVALTDFDFAATPRDLRVFLAGNGFGDHVEMHHVVTWGGLMALGAGGRVRRRVLVALDCPFRSRMALGTILAKQPEVPVLGRMASQAIERDIGRVLVDLIEVADVQPCLQRLDRRGAGIIRPRGSHKCSSPNLG